MLELDLAGLHCQVAAYDGLRMFGKLRSARGLLTATVPAAVGEVCRISVAPQRSVLAEVVGFDHGAARIMPFHDAVGLQPDAMVVGLGRNLHVPVGPELLGRVVDGLGAPIDGKGPLTARRTRPVCRDAPPPMDRPGIDAPFFTGQRVIDGMLTLGQGQRVGLFSGSGVGKSTLLGEIAKGAHSDLNVVALIGERGREVRPFLDDCLGPEGLARSVVVVSTAEQPPLMRVRAAQTAVTVADDFRRQGANVLFLLDSLTRMAMAQREIGLILGEPPSSRGYTPSVFQVLSDALEQLGRTSSGAITAILTVLVDGDDLDEPISDAVRAILDGHIVLDRQLAEKGRFPAVDVARSLSRVMRDVVPPAQQLSAQKIRALLATYAEVADLIRIGAYTPGSSAQIDRAVNLLPAWETFCRQEIDESSPPAETRGRMNEIAEAWTF